jgi:hypothetical protein
VVDEWVDVVVVVFAHTRRGRRHINTAQETARSMAISRNIGKKTILRAVFEAIEGILCAPTGH